MLPALTLAAAYRVQMLLVEASLYKAQRMQELIHCGQAGGWVGPSDCLLLPIHCDLAAAALQRALTGAVPPQLQTLHIAEQCKLLGCTAALSLLLIVHDSRPKGGLPL